MIGKNERVEAKSVQVSWSSAMTRSASTLSPLSLGATSSASSITTATSSTVSLAFFSKNLIFYSLYRKRHNISFEIGFSNYSYSESAFSSLLWIPFLCVNMYDTLLFLLLLRSQCLSFLIRMTICLCLMICMSLLSVSVRSDPGGDESVTAAEVFG